MDTRLLRTFLSLHTTGSFTATAQELAYAQSTVTAHVLALEQRLGVRLFDRLPSRTLLTAHGRQLLPIARQMLELVERAERIGDPAAGGHPVRIIAPGTICGHRLPRAASILRGQAPPVQISVAAAGTARALEALGDGSADVALIFDCEWSSGARVEGERVGAERLTVICAPSHPLAGRRAGWQRLAEHEFMLLEEGCSYSDVVARRLAMAARGRAQVSRFGNIDAVRACVAAGLGLSVVPRVTVDDAVREGRLATIEAPGLPSPRVLLVARDGEDVEPVVDRVSEVLREVFRTDG
ncbi:LysR family transcriptional regulator [Nonomuraea sp. NPDC050663]|uniref:LysR family transcriptional regulator n=1 Tax=Nonomuraea sp. NPDC050663 TaxID=3364370 RepID=UPI00378FD411